MTSPFDILPAYWQAKEAHPAPSAKARKYVRGTFGHGAEGTIPGIGPDHWAPKVWNGAQFSKPRHGGAYSKAGPVLMPVRGHNLQKGKFVEPTTSRKARKVAA